MASFEVRLVHELLRPFGDEPALEPAGDSLSSYRRVLDAFVQLEQRAVRGTPQQPTSRAFSQLIASFDDLSNFGLIPLLNLDGVDRFLHQIEFSDVSALKLVAALVGALRFETGAIFPPKQLVDYPKHLVDLQLTRYAAYAEARLAAPKQSPDELNKQLREQITAVENVLANVAGFGATIEDHHKKLSIDAQKIRDVSQERLQLEGALKKLEGDLAATSESMDEWKRQVEKAAFEAFDLKPIQSLWSARANEARSSMRAAVAILVVLFGVIPTVALFALDPIRNVVRDFIGDGTDFAALAGTAGVAALVLSRVAIVTVPLVIYFWVVRLAVRYWTRSMMLFDDARARDTTLQTYLRLITENAVSTKEDRAIVLAAICRPIPGHNNDPDQPSIAEIVNNFSPKQ